MSLIVYNTLKREKEKFEPLNAPFVSMYVCGPTVYGHAHLGHAKSYVSFDLIYRYLNHLDYKVRYVQNITDVGHLTDDADEGEDKIVKQAKKDRIEPMEIVELYTKSYFDDMDSLNVLRPDISPRASGHIIEQIDIIEDLIKKNNAYEVDGSVYFDVTSFGEYGKLSGRVLEDSVSGTRVDVKSNKRNSADFALWKKATDKHIMKWNSPWGEGFPGWHVECSAMAMKYLGESIDIHGGGLENQFPHHECEIAQSECHTNKQFVKYWMHNNMVTRDGVKMGKSLGNSITLKEAIERHDGASVRFFVLNSHYRSTLDYSEHALESSQKGLKRLLSAYQDIQFKIEYQSKEGGKKIPFEIKDYEKRFFDAMNDDLSTPEALASLFDLTKEVNSLGPKLYDKADLEAIFNFYKITLDNILGLIIDDKSGENMTSYLDAAMQLVIEVRNKARFDKDYELSDHIRNKLAEAGLELKDTPDGAKWTIK